jgi:hypothetical protein
MTRSRQNGLLVILVGLFVASFAVKVAGRALSQRAERSVAFVHVNVLDGTAGPPKRDQTVVTRATYASRGSTCVAAVDASTFTQRPRLHASRFREPHTGRRGQVPCGSR